MKPRNRNDPTKAPPSEPAAIRVDAIRNSAVVRTRSRVVTSLYVTSCRLRYGPAKRKATSLGV